MLYTLRKIISYIFIVWVMGCHGQISQQLPKGIKLKLIQEKGIDFKFEKNLYRTCVEWLGDTLFIIYPQEHSESGNLLVYHTETGKLVRKIPIHHLGILYPRFYFISEDSIICYGMPLVSLREPPRADSSICLINSNGKVLKYFSLEGLPIMTYQKSRRTFSELFNQKIENIVFYDRQSQKLHLQLGYEQPLLTYGDSLLKTKPLPAFGVIDLKNDTSYVSPLRFPAFTYQRYWPNPPFASGLDYSQDTFLLHFNHCKTSYKVHKKTYQIVDSISLGSYLIDTVGYGGYSDTVENTQWHTWLSSIENNYGYLYAWKNFWARLNNVHSKDYAYAQKSLQILNRDFSNYAEDLSVSEHFNIVAIRNDTLISFEPITDDNLQKHVIRFYKMELLAEPQQKEIPTLNSKKDFIHFLEKELSFEWQADSAAFLLVNPQLACPCISFENLCNQYKPFKHLPFHLIIIDPIQKDIFSNCSNEFISFVKGKQIYPYIKKFVNFRLILIKNKQVILDEVPPLREIADIPNKIMKFFNLPQNHQEGK